MNNLFSPDSKLVKISTRIGNFVVMNALFLLASLPIFTIGAASTALYRVCFQIGTEDEEPIMRTFWRAFRSDFKQATLLWLLFLFCGVSSILYIFMTAGLAGNLKYIATPFAVLILLIIMVASYTFPLISQFENTIPKTLRNAIVLCFGYLPKSLLILLINLIPLLVWFLATRFFMRFVWLWIFFYFSCSAYLNSRMLEKIFERCSSGKTAA